MYGGHETQFVLLLALQSNQSCLILVGVFSLVLCTWCPSVTLHNQRERFLPAPNRKQQTSTNNHGRVAEEMRVSPGKGSQIIGGGLTLTLHAELAYGMFAVTLQANITFQLKITELIYHINPAQSLSLSLTHNVVTLAVCAVPPTGQPGGVWLHFTRRKCLETFVKY